MTSEERREDYDWNRAGRIISQAPLDEMAEQRSHRKQNTRADTEPAPVIKQCLMVDAEVLRADGRRVSAISLGVGEQLAAVSDHRGYLIHGTCSVSAIRSLPFRERDVATVRAARGGGCSVKVTSNHSLMAKRAGLDVSWSPVAARDLTTAYVIAYMDHHGDFPLAQLPVQAEVTSKDIRRDGVRVIELEVDSGEVAFWVTAGPSGCFASYGELLRNPNMEMVSCRSVFIWGFSRCPKNFREALGTSGELKDCRDSLEAAGFSFVLPSGGHMFVRPTDAELVMSTLSRQRIEPRVSEVVVAPEFETRLEEALALIPPSQSVRRCRADRVPLDTAMAALDHSRSGRPFRYLAGSIVVEGRRTFIDIDADAAHSQVTASTTDLNKGASNRNPRARARARSGNWP